MAPFIILFLCAYASQQLTIPTGSILIYLPIPVAIILVHWWGPRVLPGLLLNAIIVTLYWDQTDLTLHPLVIFHETACVLASWCLFSCQKRGKSWLPDIVNVLRFIVLGIIIPISINSGLLYFSKDVSLEYLSIVWTADFASSIALALPLLYFVSPWMERHGYSIQQGSQYVKPTLGLRLVRNQRFEIGISFAGLLVLSLVLPFEKFWFIHGLFSIYIGVRFGFGLSLLANLAVFLVTYVVPYFTMNTGENSWILEAGLLNIHFGMCLLGITACVTGRVISDLKAIERKLNQQFNELEQVHDELDRFVYSASHDLSAPLKTILGIVAVSKLEKDTSKYMVYFDKIETYTKKLEGFIKEILDYSRNKRLDKSAEWINLRSLTSEVLENFLHTDRLPEINLKIIDQEAPQFMADRMRMKIVLNNLLSNAIRYQHFNNAHTPAIIIQSEISHQHVMIHVKDNGHGIKKEYLGKIFNMFFRASVDSCGSGLGLYIAKEAVKKMNGKITVRSIHGKGSIFTVHLPKN